MRSLLSSTILRSYHFMFAVMVAATGCGPTAPSEPDATTTAAGTSTTTAAATSNLTSSADMATSTSTGTSGGTPTGGATETTGVVGTSTSSTGPDHGSTSADETTIARECVADPAQGICSEGCDSLIDCCQCGGKRIKPEDGFGCTIAMGIVTAQCPWDVWNVYWDGEHIFGWMQSEQNGDIVVEFVGDQCTALLAGEFREIWIEVFCEAA